MIARSMSAVTALTPYTHKALRGNVPGSRRTGPCSGPVSQRKSTMAIDRQCSPPAEGR